MNNLDNKTPDSSDDTLKNRYLTFMVDDVGYGIEIQCVTEIINLQTITKIPELPEYIKGIINLRGKIIPVMDMRIRFSKEVVEYNDRTCIIVIDVENVTAGLIVDSVSEVMTIQEEDISDPPQAGTASSGYIRKLGKTQSGIKLILDCQRILSDPELDGLNEENYMVGEEN